MANGMCVPRGVAWGTSVVEVDVLQSFKALSGWNEALSASLDEWGQLGFLPELVFVEGASSSMGAEPLNGFLGMTETTQFTEILRVRMSVASDADWTAYDLQTVVKHELGHFFGLPDVDAPGTLMHWQVEPGVRLVVTEMDAEIAAEQYSESCVGCSISHGASGSVCFLVAIVAALLIWRK